MNEYHPLSDKEKVELTNLCYKYDIKLPEEWQYGYLETDGKGTFTVNQDKLEKYMDNFLEGLIHDFWNDFIKSIIIAGVMAIFCFMFIIFISIILS